MDLQSIAALKQKINQVIYENNDGDITASELNGLLKDMADTLEGQAKRDDPKVFLSEVEYEALSEKVPGTLYYTYEE